MNQTETILYGQYLASLMGHSINSTDANEACKDFDWDMLYKLAYYHNVIPLIYPVISKLSIPDNVLKKFEYDNRRFIAREAQQELESRRVFAALNENNIKFIKLKGIVIKNLYPLPYMRTSSDIDICMSPEDRSRSKEIMESLGYRFDGDIDYNSTYTKEDFFIYELHSSVVSDKSPYHSIFQNPFDISVKDTDNINYILSPDYFYIHLTVHTLNHFLSGGCGLRQLCDLYVFEKSHPDLNKNNVRKILKKYNLEKFSQTMESLSCKLFEGNPLTAEETEIAVFIFKSGEYGNGNLKHISWLSEDKNINWNFKNKCKYFLSLWFPPAKKLNKRYPVLEKAPVLLPICWLRRIFHAVFFKKGSIKAQRDEINLLNSQKVKEAKRIRNLAGLK